MADPDAEAEFVATADPDELLETAEDHLRRGRRDAAYATWHLFDERYAGADLTPLQRARRADGHGIEAANNDRLIEAETAWRSAVTLYAESGDEVRRQAARGRIGRVMCATGRGDAGLTQIEEAASYLLAHAGPDRWTGALMAVASAHLQLGRPDDALAALERARQYLPSCLDRHAAAHIAVQRAQSLGSLGRMADAYDAAIDAARVCREVEFEEGVAHAHMMAGFAAEHLGERDRAITAYEEAMSTTTDADLIKQVRVQRAGLLAGSHRASEVIDDLHDVVAERSAAGDQDGAAQARQTLALAYLNAGRAEECARTCEETLADLTDRRRQVNDPEDPDGRTDLLTSARHVLALAYLRLDRSGDAIAQLELVQAEHARRHHAEGVGQAAEEIGDVLSAQDHDAEAALRYLSAAEAFRAAELVIDEVRNRRQYAMSLLWSNDVDAAMSALGVLDELTLRLPDSDDGAWERATVLVEGARVLRSAGRVDEAVVRAGGAATAFRSMGLGPQAAHSDLLLAQLLLRAGRAAQAEVAARRGLGELTEGDEGWDTLTALLTAALAAQRGNLTGE